MAIVIQNPKKKHVAIVAVIVAVVIALFGTFAWYSFNQQARNIFIGLVQPDVNLHDDFWEPNKDVYVENSGEKTVYVRVSFKEYMEIAKESIYPSSLYDDAETWEKHYDPATPCPVDNCTLDFHKYYDWIMGNAGGDPGEGWKWYIPAPEELKSQYDADGNQIQDSAQTVYGVKYDTDEYGNKTVTPQVSEKGFTYAQIEAAMAKDAKYAGLLSTYKTNQNVTTRTQLEKYAFDTWGVKMTEKTTEVMTMQQWQDAGAKPGPYWVMDVDGWFYWAEALEPGLATGLLLSEVVLKGANKPSNDWFYAIDVYLNAVDADDFNRLGATPEALKLLYLATGEYVDSGEDDGGGNTIWYKKLGPNVYESGKIVTASNGTSSWQAIEKFVGGALSPTGELIEANFIMIGKQFDFDPKATNIPTDAQGGMLGAGSDYTITDFVKGVDGLWYFEINYGQCYVRAVSDDQTMALEGGGSEQGTGLLGYGPHEVVWVPKNGPTGQPGRLGDKSNLNENPWYVTQWDVSGGGDPEYVTLYHVGNGVYYRVVEDGDSDAFEMETWTDPVTGDVITRPKPYVTAKDRNTITGIGSEAVFNDTFMQIGDYYTKDAGENPYVASNISAMAADGTGAFEIVDIVYSRNDGKYYLLVDDGRQNGDGTPIYAYYAMSQDGTLGNADDYKVWPGGNGIGSRDDTTIQPSPIPANVAVGGSFSELGKFWQQETDDKTYPQPYEYIEWDVLAIEGSKMLVITRDIIYGAPFDTGSSGSSGATNKTWADSSLRTWLNTTFVDTAFAEGAGFNGGDAKKQIVLTKVETGKIGGYNNPATNYVDGPSNEGGTTLDYVFLLSSEEFKKYFPSDAVRKSTFTPYTLSKKLGELNLWTRNRFDNNGYITLVSGSTGGVGGVRQFPHQTRGVRAAMWIEFDSQKWGSYGTAGSGGTWTQNNAANSNGGVTKWKPGEP